ncbi:hypothetical protein H5392_10660 [Tessaracoccus sp. MC1865]|uniref:hypothetical protein n=1 Tax=Tessaracoccus sp. MC1865 TaxID=2760310 RepID=UPI0016020671|nr:hypothetical protein [Tessaracoccus sp. MC1865]MBB1484318.1 hypothetical protein [Tessaracoccus sp. MC1865]QTO38564.1 hypothetical protein J7D54_05655 [Tessaracoccus sp. MC1865]
MNVRPAALLASLFLAVAGSWVASPSASAAVTDGHCTTDTGVTLVVDHQELGGGRIIKCVEDVPGGTSGLGLLKLAGLSAEGTLHDGPGFVCRINGRPSLNESIPVDGSPDYRERCVDTPPKTAFWSYWHAPNNGSWTFSQMGGGNREVIPGGYEGWSFSLNNTENSNPPPGVTPSHRVVKPQPAPTTKAPAPTTQAPAATTTAPAATTAAATTPAPATTPAAPTTAAPARTTTQPRTSTKPRVVSTPTEPSRSASPEAPAITPSSAAPENVEATPSASASPTVASVVTETAAASASPTDEQVAAPEGAPPVAATVADDGGVPTGTLVGAGAVAAIGLGGGVMWWRRRGL